MQTNQWTGGAPKRAKSHRPFHSFVNGVIAMLILALAPSIFPADSAVPALFETSVQAAGDTVAAAAPKKGYQRTRLAKLNPQLLTAPASPLRQAGFQVAGDAANVSLNLFADKELPVVITRTDFKGEGVFVSSGVVIGKPQSTVLLSVNGDVMAGTISVPGEPMLQILPAADGFHQVGEINADELPHCGNNEVLPPVIGGGDVVPGTAGDAAVVVDVMVIYTAAARIGAGGTGPMQALVDLAIAEANNAYSNSAVNVTLNLVYRGEIAYTESGNANTDLTRVAAGSNSQLAPILTLRNSYGADVVTLVTESMATYAGLGYVMKPVSSGFAPYAFNVIRRQYLTGSYVYPHEVGHNMGCMHDRENSGSSGAFDYSYGYRFDASGTTYRTVMAYAPGVRIPYFSNPDVSYLGTATGVAAGETNSANNALSLSNAVPTIASFRSSSQFFNFDATTADADEDGGTVTLTVNLTGSPTNTVTVSYSTSAVTASAGSDYTTASGTLTFATNETSKTIVVTLLNNGSVEADETFKVVLSSPTGGPVIGPSSQATVTVIDDDIGITLASTTASVSEGGTNVVLTVNRSGGLTNTVDVDYATADVSAVAGSDYTNTFGTLTFTNGVTSQTITIPIIDDSDIETNQTFKVTLSNATGAAVITSGTNVVTIVENDSSLSFSTNAVGLAENGTLTLTVTRTGGTAGTITVDYLTDDATATAGSDYTNTSGTLTFTNGQSLKTITVPLNNDSSVEGDETFSVALTNATGGSVLGTHTNVTATIRDNDSVFNVATNAVSYSETATSATIAVQRTGGTVGAATVRYSATNDTATAGTDFRALSGTLSFAAGETNKLITISFINDTSVETNETFTIGLHTPTGEGAVGTNDVATVTITDNDSLLGFTASTLSTDETATNLTLTVERTGTLSLTNTIKYAFKSGSAGTSDYTGANGTLTFVPGDTNKTITFAILDDGVVEANETFQVILSVPTGGAAITGTNTATITILGTDIGVGFAATTYSIAEDGTSVVLTLNRSGSTNGTVTVDYATVDVGATAGTDYTNTSGTLTFTNGVASQTITVPIVDDSDVETNETFKVTLSNVSGGYILGGTNSVVTILENDATIALSTNAVSVSEVATNVTFTVVRTGGTNTTMTVDFLTADGTATDGADYTATNETLSFAPGQKTKTITVPLSADSSVEGNETFTLSLTNATAGAVLGLVTNVTATILDNDSVFAVATNAITVTETAGTATITVVRTGGVVGAATVKYATTNDTATAGSDYTAATGTLSFAAGQTNKTFTVRITNDTSYETNETFTVGLNTPTGEGTLSTNSVVTLTISDNDSTISFETNAVTVAESAGTVTLNVTRSGTLTLTNTVPFTFKAGTATAADCTWTNGVLIFAPDETNKTITASINNDSLIETNETFTITLGTPTGGALIGSAKVATVTITENDAAVSFLASTASVWEDETNVVLTVKRTGDVTSTVTVDYATSDLTATVSDDYTNTSGTLTFTNGVSSLTVTIPVVEDATVESNETLKLTLSNPSGAVISGTNAATVTIRENNSAFKLSASSYTGREGTNAIITLTRIGNTNTAFAATLVTDYTGAATNTDFTAVNTNLTFSTGQVSLTFSVPITKDSVVDTNETFDVQIVTADSGFEAVAPTNAVVTITENTGALQFSASAASVLETATNVLLTVTRTGGTNNTLAVDYVTADGTATAGVDYTAVTNTVTFLGGQASKQISIPLTNDSSVEGDETFTVTLSNPDGAVLGSTTVSTVTIKDNDSVIAVATNAVTVAETSGKANLSITRTGGVAAAATIQYTTTNETASAASDYTAATGTLTFAAGETNKVLALTILNDASYETNETFKLVLTSPTAEATLSTNDTVTLTVTDNDSTLSWDTNAVSIAEDGGTVTLTVNRTGTLDLTNTVTYSFKAGTAKSSDYTSTNGMLTFAPNDTNKTITVAIVNDSIVESDETFSVTLSRPTAGSVIGGTNIAYVTIVENDIGLGLATATRIVAEDATNIVLTVNRLGSTNGTVSVDYTFTSLTATNDVDFNGTNDSLSFTNGVTSLTLTVPIVNDTDIEANETFRVNLTNPSGAILSTSTNTVITILEDDSSFAFTTNAVPVSEVATTIALTVRRTGGTNTTATVDYLTADGTATDGADYTSTNNTLTFLAGQATKTINVPLSNDSTVEGDETFTLSLTNVTGTAAVLGAYTNSTVTIRDNDSVFSVYTNALSVAENVGSATITIRRTGGVVGVASVQYATANDSATAGSDYTATAKTLSFKAGETNKVLTVKITNDSAAESDETLTLTLTSPTGEATLSTNVVTTVTIVDNDFAIGDIAGSVAPISIASLRWAEDGTPLLTIGGPLGGYVVLDASSDMVEWTTLTEESLVTSTIEVSDKNCGTGNRFYRLRPAPADGVSQ